MVKVLIYSWFNTDNFGDRLGYYAIQKLFPVDYELYFRKINPFDYENPKDYDLLCIGTGNSIFDQILLQPLNQDKFSFVDHIKKFKKIIGVFGFQYLPFENHRLFSDFLDIFDHIFFRFTGDQNYAQKYSKREQFFLSSTHVIGDIVSTMFPLTNSGNTEEGAPDYIKVNKQAYLCNKVDRLIQYIQLANKIETNRLHVLLCAMCSTPIIKWFQQSEIGDKSSGKIEAMFEDVLGYVPVKHLYFVPDRIKIKEYKQKVENQINQAKIIIKKMIKV